MLPACVCGHHYSSPSTASLSLCAARPPSSVGSSSAAGVGVGVGSTAAAEAPPAEAGGDTASGVACGGYSGEHGTRPVDVCQLVGGNVPLGAQPSPLLYTPVRMAAVLSAVHAGVGYPCTRAHPRRAQIPR